MRKFVFFTRPSAAVHRQSGKPVLPKFNRSKGSERERERLSERSQRALRVLEPDRRQVELRACDLESLLSEEHRARLVWGYVERQDLSALFDAIKARVTQFPGARRSTRASCSRCGCTPTLDGVGSGREVAGLIDAHDAYRWICGGVAVNYRALNDFRSGNDKLMDELLSDNVVALVAVGTIMLERVARTRSHRSDLLDHPIQHRSGHGIYALKSLHNLSKLTRLGIEDDEAAWGLAGLIVKSRAAGGGALAALGALHTDQAAARRACKNSSRLAAPCWSSRGIAA